jgi:hypothetical protein
MSDTDVMINNTPSPPPPPRSSEVVTPSETQDEINALNRPDAPMTNLDSVVRQESIHADAGAPVEGQDFIEVDAGPNVLLYHGKMYGPNRVRIAKSSLPTHYMMGDKAVPYADDEHERAFKEARARVDRERMIRQGVLREELGQNSQFLSDRDLEVPIHQPNPAVQF